MLLLLWLVASTMVLYDVLLIMRIMGHHERVNRLTWLAGGLLYPLAAAMLTPWWGWALLLGFLAVLAHGAWHTLWVVRQRQRLLPAAEAMSSLMAELCSRWSIRRPHRVWVDPGDQIGPAVFGLWRQELVLPTAALQLPLPELESILAHELAHVQRRDPLKLWGLGVLQTILGWHPLARRTIRHLAFELELQADRGALAWFGDRTAYARTLGRWGLYRAAARVGWVARLAARSADLLLRLEAVLDPARPAPHLPPPARLAGRMTQPRPLLPTAWVVPYFIVYLALFGFLARFV